MKELGDNTNTTNNIDKIDSGLYGALVAHQLHQDNLLWSRTQLIIAIQSGILVAGFILRECWLGTIIMMLGAFFSFGVLCLMLKDEADRKVNQPVMDKLADRLVPMDIKKELNDELKKLEESEELTDEEKKRLTDLEIYKKRFVWFSSPDIPKWRKWARGGPIFRFTVIFFIILDIVLAILYALLTLGNPLVKKLIIYPNEVLTPKPVILNSGTEDSSTITDYVITVWATIYNKGKGGVIYLEAQVNQGEGAWSRRVGEYVESGGRATLKIRFPEVSLGGGEITYSVKAYPGRISPKRSCKLRVKIAFYQGKLLEIAKELSRRSGKGQNNA